MAARKLDNYLRSYRKASGLSQGEVAFLLGCQDGTKVSRYESRRRRPNLESAWGYEIIFGARPEELFAGAVQKVEERIVKRARLLTQELEGIGAPNRLTTRKLETLRAIAPGWA